MGEAVGESENKGAHVRGSNYATQENTSGTSGTSDTGDTGGTSGVSPHTLRSGHPAQRTRRLAGVVHTHLPSTVGNAAVRPPTSTLPAPWKRAPLPSTVGDAKIRSPRRPLGAPLGLAPPPPTVGYAKFGRPHRTLLALLAVAPPPPAVDDTKPRLPLRTPPALVECAPLASPMSDARRRAAPRTLVAPFVGTPPPAPMKLAELATVRHATAVLELALFTPTVLLRVRGERAGGRGDGGERIWEDGEKRGGGRTIGGTHSSTHIQTHTRATPLAWSYLAILRPDCGFRTAVELAHLPAAADVPPLGDLAGTHRR